VERNRKPVRGSGDFPWTIVAAGLSLVIALSWGSSTVVRAGQEVVGSTAQGSVAQFRAQSDLVLVPVTVLTGAGRAVPGLSREHFSVFDNRLPQVITHFTAEDAPAAIGLVLDCSSSMEGRLAVSFREAGLR
jgi:hypothetical protein